MTHGERLLNLPQLRVGDDVIVETRDATYTYRLINDGDSLEVTNPATWVLDPVPANPEGGVQPAQDPGQSLLLTLVACAEVFHSDNRLIAFAELVDTQPRG